MADPTIEVVSGVVMDASEACTETHGIFAAKCEKVLFVAALRAYPKRVSVEQAVKGSEYGPKDAIVKKSAGRLRTLRLVAGDNDGLLASDKLV